MTLPKKPFIEASSAAINFLNSSSSVGAAAGDLFAATSATSVPEPGLSFLRKKKRLRVGVHIKARASDVNNDTAMVTAKALKNVPVTPVITTKGRNTTT